MFSQNERTSTTPSFVLRIEGGHRPPSHSSLRPLRDLCALCVQPLFEPFAIFAFNAASHASLHDHLQQRRVIRVSILWRSRDVIPVGINSE
ncbi:MAG TPA: hypothetical protein DF699_11435 [Phycisphaerales bacterium]|nr:hypothetical protein [Phycisphaerae bacterium]HCT45814.1 hypothetical protein [Phycisphaerales bacterium]